MKKQNKTKINENAKDEIKTKATSKTTKENKMNITKEILVANEKVKKILTNSYCLTSMKQVENSDVDINHLENIFTNETYYAAMKLVPLLERKVLYLSYVENVRLNNICKRLKLRNKEAIYLRNKGITHFKNNLETLYKLEKLKKGGKIQWKN